MRTILSFGGLTLHAPTVVSGERNGIGVDNGWFLVIEFVPNCVDVCAAVFRRLSSRSVIPDFYRPDRFVLSRYYVGSGSVGTAGGVKPKFVVYDASVAVFCVGELFRSSIHVDYANYLVFELIWGRGVACVIQFLRYHGFYVLKVTVECLRVAGRGVLSEHSVPFWSREETV